MIKLSRTTSPPPAFAGRNRVEKNLTLIRSRDAGGNPDPKIWRPAKGHLKRETHGKCAFCESATSTVAYGDVEHFRPKSIYWWLAYCYDNLSYTCQLCNQRYKRAKFRVARDDRRWRGPRNPAPSDELARKDYARLMTPDPIDRDAGGMPFGEFVRATAREKPYLVDPYAEDPEELYKWEADPVLKEVRIVARTKRVRAMCALMAAEEDLGLNREELRRRRWHTYEMLVTLLWAAETLPARSEAGAAVKAQVQAMLGAEREYAAMARYFARAEPRPGPMLPPQRNSTPEPG